jgi:hypothetical protein
MTANSARSIRRGSLLIEVAMAAVLLMIAMGLTVKVLGLVAVERRASERRQRALSEVGNLMERITAYPFDEVTPELGRQLALTSASRQSFPGAELAVDVADNEPGAGRSAKRVAIRLRWRGPEGEWVAPVRLTSWIERRRRSS